MNRDEGRRRRLLQVASAAAFLAIAGAAVAIVLVSANSGSGGDTQLEGVAAVRSELQGIPQHGLVLGQPGAKATLYEYGDLQCPVCKAVSERVLPPAIQSRVRSGAARIVFRNFAILGGESVTAGAAAIAAGHQDRGWSYVDLFYGNQGTEDSGYVDDAFLTAIARAAGVPDIARWNRERSSPEAAREVEATTAEAQGLGFTGTPSFAITGPSTEGVKTLGLPESPADLETAIDAAS